MSKFSDHKKYDLKIVDERMFTIIVTGTTIPTWKQYVRTKMPK